MKINQWLQSNPLEAKLKHLERQAQKSTPNESMSASDRSIAILEASNNKTFTIEEKKGIGAFLQHAEGDDSSKMKTVQTAINKGVSLSEEHLLSMHKALNEAPLSVDQLENIYLSESSGEEDELTIGKLIDDSALPESVKSVIKEAINQGKPLKEAVLIGLKKILSDANLTESAGAIDVKYKGDVNALLQSISSMLNQKGVTPQSFQASLQTIADQADLTMADLKTFLIQLVKTVAETLQAKQEDITQDEAKGESGDESQLKATTPSSVTSDVQAQPTVIEAKSSLESSPKPVNDDQDEAQDLMDFVEDKLNTLNDHMTDVLSEMVVKMYAVKETTALTAALKQEFKTVQNEVSHQLEKVIQAIEPQNTQEEPIQAKPVDTSELIGKAIDKLNQTITKSDLTLYTSMKNERDLLVASSDLTKARQLLAQGKQTEALTILKKTHSLVNKMVFTPEKKRIELFATRQMTRAMDTIEQSDHRYKNQQNLKSVLQILSNDSNHVKARDVVETVRFMGVNHEVELANQMDQKEQPSKRDLVNANIKEILIKLSKEETDKRTVEQTESSLMNLNGQQMMNDFNQREQGQSYYFNYPVTVEGEAQNMKVFLSGKGNQSLDWQNAEMVFGLTTEKYGQVGIRVKSVSGKLELKVLTHEKSDLSSQLAGLEEAFLELGFTDFTVKSEVNVPSDEASKTQDVQANMAHQRESTHQVEPALAEGGFDFKI